MSDLVFFKLMCRVFTSSNGGAMRDRTADPLRARQVLSQLSYSPLFTCLFNVMLRCTRLSFSHILLYVPSFVPSYALLNLKNPA